MGRMRTKDLLEKVCAQRSRMDDEGGGIVAVKHRLGVGQKDISVLRG
jgi:hypothetical protein